MQQQHRPQQRKLKLYLTHDQACSYLTEQLSRTLFVDPTETPNAALYGQLLDTGFRRSGNHVYRPHCRQCQACVSVRIPVSDFRPRRSQKRCYKRIASNVQVAIKPPTFDPEHFALYQRYTLARHGDGDMKDIDAAQYLEFLATDWCATAFIEFRWQEQLMAVAVTDQLAHALSAVYTFFDPALSHHSPGVFAILWQIGEARRLGLQHLYLGYWISDSGKMNYKAEYRPLEAWNGYAWRRFEPGETLSA